MFGLRKIISGALFAATGALVSYAAFAAVFHGTVAEANTGAGHRPGAPYVVATLQEASVLGRFDVKSPGFVPKGFERGDIGILPVPPTVKSDLPPTVIFSWASNSPTGGSLELIQNTTLDDLGDPGTTPVAVAGTQGKRSFQVADESRPVSFVTYFWKNGDVSYVLTGFLGDSLTEDDVLAVANSIR